MLVSVNTKSCSDEKHLSSKSNELTLKLVVVTGSVLVALVMGELMLRVFAASITAPERMDPGLIQYHNRYGWRLSPNWQGQHHHVDYDVTYKVDARGFRESLGQNADAPLVVVVGDSFTFGLGVNNGETYIDRLNDQVASYRVLNAAVPGYAPEQSLLVAENLVPLLKPDSLLFVVYLGNDLIDLGLPYPVQAEQAKPFASVEGGAWHLKNIPVSKSKKPDELKQLGLSAYIVAPDSIPGMLSGLKIVQLLQGSGLFPGEAELNQQAISQSLLLFAGILDRLEQLAITTEVKILLIPGSNAVRQPSSTAGRYQQLIADNVTELVATRPFELINTLQSGVFADLPNAYFANDGHLTPIGHQALADHFRENVTFGSIPDG